MPYYIKRWPKKAKKETKEVAGEKKTKPRSKPNLVKKLDRVFALYIRLRDAMPNGYVRCISCGNIKSFEEVDCGHYHSRVHMGTRFDEENCNAECQYCNRFSADHLDKYAINLVKKIGQSRFDMLRVKAKTPKHYMDFELEQMIKHYTLEVKRLSTLKGIRVNL